MTRSNYFIGPTGLLLSVSKYAFGLLPGPAQRAEPPIPGEVTNDQHEPHPTTRRQQETDDQGSALHLEDIEELLGVSVNTKGRYPDGPWLTHPDQIDDESLQNARQIRDDMTVQEFRESHKIHVQGLFKPEKAEIEEVLCVIDGAPRVDMEAIAAVSEELDSDQLELVDLAVERWFVNSPVYLEPGTPMTPSMLRDHREDWVWNARGVYYRHFYSSEWVTEGRSLWVPTLDEGANWNDPGEESRRIRAQRLVKHALDNERWNKSEYAWDADAWSDAFGQMRDDPVIAA